MLAGGCRNNNNNARRISVARAGDVTLYLDQITDIIMPGTPPADSAAIIQNYINKWAKRELLFQKAEENLSPELRSEIENQLEESRINLVIYQYQRQMMLEKMDTMVTDNEMGNYYSANQESFVLSSNILKALFIKLPAETPNVDKVRILSRSNEQADLQQLETICYQFADKFDDFNEKWIPLNRISVELPNEIVNEENFLRRTSFYETSDSTFIYIISIRDYKLRSSVAPFEYVRDDIKRIIWNNRRFDFIQSLENGIYNDAIKENNFKLF
jgi:HEPN domain-containing protein